VPQKPLIACVDEDVSAREAIEGLLKVSGFTPEVFSSAEESLQSARLVESCSGLSHSCHRYYGVSRPTELGSRPCRPERSAFAVSPSMRGIS
jgi:hypothetical protein